MLNTYRANLKKVAFGLLTLGLLLGTTACSTSDFQTLEKAEAKTESAVTGTASIDLQIENNLLTSGLTAEQLKVANYMKAVAYKGDYSFDKSKQQAMSQSWINLGGIGFDFTYYQDQDKRFIRYPVLKKYIDLNQMTKQGGQAMSLSPETQKALSDIWSKLYTEETVKQVEKTFVETAEGDVKATRYDVTASGEAVKEAILASQKLILEDPMLKEQLVVVNKQASQVGEQVEILGLPDNTQLKDFQMSAYVDADGYLIKEVIYMGLTLPESVSGYWMGTDFKMTTTYAKLGQSVVLDIPQVTAADMMTEEELERDMPAAFSDLVK